MNFEPILYFYSRFLTKFYHRIAICKLCSHIQFYPLFRELELEKINKKFFEKQFLNCLQNNQKKIITIDQRLSSLITSGMNVLDVGAGEAGAMDYFQKKNSSSLITLRL